ncbi:MAG: hypothetical protein L3J34_00445 [Flavobacteriaceae bacterium]|nr:hypothetical protein [Flavobacteriaceae bacterium]
MKKIIIFLVMIGFFLSCQNNNKSQGENQTDVHGVKVQEVLQVSEYTYLRVLEDGKEKWLAAPSVQVEKGKTYYFKNGMEMTNFESKELNKTFEKIYFIDKLSTDPNMKVETANSSIPKKNDMSHQATKPKLEKAKVQIPPTEGIVTIAELYENIKKYEGKQIKIRGKVTKYNPAILKKNWIHLQDGTAFNDKFDFTATINNEVKVGDFVTIEGVIAVNKDFGYGYVYEVIMENASLVK